MGRKKFIKEKAVPKFTSEREEKVKILINFCISKLNNIGISLSRKSRSKSPREGWRHGANELKRAITMKMATKDSEGSNVAADFKGYKTISMRRRVDGMEGLNPLL